MQVYVVLLEESFLCANVCVTLLIGSLSCSTNFATNQPFKIINFTIQIDCFLAKAQKKLSIMKFGFDFVHYFCIFLKNHYTRFESQD